MNTATTVIDGLGCITAPGFPVEIVLLDDCYSMPINMAVFDAEQEDKQLICRK